MEKRFKKLKARETTVVVIIILLLVSFLISIYSLNKKTTDTRSRAVIDPGTVSAFLVTGGGTVAPGSTATVTVAANGGLAYNAITADFSFGNLIVEQAASLGPWSAVATITAQDPIGTTIIYNPPGDINGQKIMKIFPAKTGEYTAADLGGSVLNTSQALTMTLKIPTTPGVYSMTTSGVIAYVAGGTLPATGNTISFTVLAPTTTSTPVPIATATSTPKPTATNTPTPKPTVTNTPVPTATNTPTPTPKPTATNTPIPTATLSPTPTPFPFKSQGDFNGDRQVTLLDLSILAKYWCPTGACQTGSSQADANNDGVVDISDLGILAENWLKLF